MSVDYVTYPLLPAINKRSGIRNRRR